MRQGRAVESGSIIIMGVLPVLPSAVFVTAGANQLDSALKRFESYLGATRPESEIEALSRAGAPQWYRELGLELPAEGRHRHAGAGSLRDRHGDVSVVGGEGVAPAAADRAGIGDVAV